MKAGIMETADLFVVNKSDLPGAAQLAAWTPGVSRARYRLRSLLERRIVEATAALPGEFFDAPFRRQVALAHDRLRAA